MCPHCRAFITTSDKICPYCDTPVGPKAVERRNPGDLVGGLIPHAQFVTVLILTLNVGMFAVTMLASMKAGNPSALMGVDGRTLIEFGAKWREGLLAGQWWRLVTAGFLHGGLMHIAMNSWAMFDVGATVEQLYGQRRLVVIYFVSTVCGYLASAIWTPAISVGASAGLFGLIGAMIALGVKHEGPAAKMVRGVYIRWAVYGVLFGLLPGLRIDNAAHLGGLASGFAVAYVAGLPRLVTNWREKFWTGAMVVCLALTAISFLLMFLWLRQVTAVS